MADVSLAIYDLSGGLAKTMSAAMGDALGGTVVEMVPHTGVRVFGKEYVMGGGIRAQAVDAVVAMARALAMVIFVVRGQ